jgi:enoyl-CoA hydratase
MSVLVGRDGPVFIVTIDRAAKRNAVDPATAAALRSAFADFAADEGARVAILTGSGGHFCAGFDLTAVGASRYDPDGPGPMGPTRMLLGKPVIAAVEGHAVAGGLELALWCDLRVAAEGAVFGVYCRRWGVPLIDGGTVRLPRIVGQGRALDMILTGRPVDAGEAQRIGLADRVVADGDALAAAVALAKQIAAFPQLCMTSDRKSAYRQWDLHLEAALANEAHAGVAPLREGAAAGARRFTEGEGRSGSFAAFKGD